MGTIALNGNQTRAIMLNGTLYYSKGSSSTPVPSSSVHEMAYFHRGGGWGEIHISRNDGTAQSQNGGAGAVLSGEYISIAFGESTLHYIVTALQKCTVRYTIGTNISTTTEVFIKECEIGDIILDQTVDTSGYFFGNVEVIGTTEAKNKINITTVSTGGGDASIKCVGKLGSETIEKTIMYQDTDKLDNDYISIVYGDVQYSWTVTLNKPAYINGILQDAGYEMSWEYDTNIQYSIVFKE